MTNIDYSNMSVDTLNSLLEATDSSLIQLREKAQTIQSTLVDINTIIEENESRKKKIQSIISSKSK